MAFTWNYDDYFMPETGRSTKFRLHIGANSAAGGRVKGANVGDTHWS